jgi:hypothetical protein
MFEKISDYSELLFPESLLERWSFLDLLINEVDETDFKEVEILGWLYQYYISDKKDILINAKKKYKTEDIPAVTQLFTSKWIVQYMVENTIWKTWLESHPNKELQAKWEYYIESEDTNEVNPNLKPEDITVLDPAMWSWHILVYAFEVLFDIYKSAWYTNDEIPKLIIENNLFWLEIDNRAYQIACFAIIMKARKYDKKILKEIKNNNLKINAFSINETQNCDVIDELLYPNLAQLCTKFKQASLIWSLITIKNFDEEKINEEFEAFQKEWTIFNSKLIQLLPKIINQARLLHSKYSCVVSNPPYMGWKYMNKELWDYVKKNFPDTKSDLFAVFMERNFEFTKSDWMLWFMTPFVWMFIQSYQKLRESIIDTKTISSLIQLEYNAFENACIPICTFTIRNYKSDVKWDYIKLSDFRWSENQPIKTLEAINNPEVDYKYKFDTNNFKSIPWSPIAYWVSDKVREIFEQNNKIESICKPSIWQNSWNNDLYLKIWTEVVYNKIDYKITDISETLKSKLKWVPYFKWWDFRKWFWNQVYIMNWENDWKEIKDYAVKRNNWKHWSRYIQNLKVMFKESVSCSAISSSTNSYRYYQEWWMYDVNFRSFFIPDKNIQLYFLTFLNSKVSIEIWKNLWETLALNSNDLNRLPIIFPNSQDIKNKIDNLTQQNIDISKEEWNSRETSWDFSQNELLKHKSDNSLENSYNNYCEYWNDKFFTQHKNEEELNRLFIEIYWLESEMTSEVELNDITLLKTETKIEEWELVFQKEEIVKQFISYAVGCMMWRYSLNNEWLVFAGWEFDSSKYSSFEADDDGIIPVLSDEYFDDDIVARFKEFVKVAFGEDKINQNLDFIANGLTKRSSETSLVRIRRYFANEFYKDHCARYKKRPIYWMFTSWKDKTFNALVYLHRYEKWIISTLRMEYLIKLQWKLEWQRRQIESNLVSAEWRTKLDFEKDKNDIIKKIDILKHYDEKLKHLAEQKIELDLDDGVKVNYPKLWELLEAIKL